MLSQPSAATVCYSMLCFTASTLLRPLCGISHGQNNISRETRPLFRMYAAPVACPFVTPAVDTSANVAFEKGLRWEAQYTTVPEVEIARLPFLVSM